MIYPQSAGVGPGASVAPPSSVSSPIKHARTLVEQYRLDDGMFQLRIRASSPYVGAPADRLELGE